MSIDELNQRWGNRREIEFFWRTPGFPAVKLRHTSGSELEVSLYGGQVLSWLAEGRERLFLSERAEFSRGKAIRGGIPLVFPQFGSGPLPAHGFARTSEFSVLSASAERGCGVQIVLGLVESPESLKLWRHKFALRLVLSLAEDLYMELVVENTDSEPFEFQSLLHTYFAVPEIGEIRVRGLAGTRVVDFLSGGRETIEPSNDLPVTKQTDQLYLEAPDCVAITDGEGAPIFEIEKERLADFVLWNPWIEKSAHLADLAPNAYRGFVCLEAGNVRSKISLAPGESYTSAQRLRPI